VLRFPRETNRDKPGTIDDSVSGISLFLSPLQGCGDERNLRIFSDGFSVYIFVGSPFFLFSSWLVFPFFSSFICFMDMECFNSRGGNHGDIFLQYFVSPPSFVRRILLRLDPIYSLLNLQTIGHAAGGIEFNSLCSCQGGGGWMIGTALEKKQNQRRKNV
jgi:hypothetical protein